MPRRRSLFSSSVRSKHCKTLIHSRSSSSSCSTANKENAPSSSCFSSLSSNQTGLLITLKICLLPLSSLQTTPSSQQLSTSLSAHPHPQMMTMPITTKCFLSTATITIVLTHSDVSLEYEYHPSAPLSTITSQQQLNALESAEDVQNRHDVYHQLYVLVPRQRQQKA